MTFILKYVRGSFPQSEPFSRIEDALARAEVLTASGDARFFHVEEEGGVVLTSHEIADRIALHRALS